MAIARVERKKEEPWSWWCVAGQQALPWPPCSASRITLWHQLFGKMQNPARAWEATRVMWWPRHLSNGVAVTRPCKSTAQRGLQEEDVPA